MSQIQYSANLSNDDFPLLSSLQGRTVIVGKTDQDFELEINNQKLQREKRIPQAYYAHNVMPTGHGYQSIGFSEKISAHPTATDFGGYFTIRDIDENKSFFSPSGGKNYIWDRNVATWVSVSPIIGNENAIVTFAYLGGETYIFYEKIGCFKYNKITRLLETVILIGLNVTLINGICSSAGFMLAWDDANTIYRGQANSPLNFTPAPELGSGSGVPEDIRGKIVTVLSITNGYIVYTTDNAVGASFQQNIRYPFVYKEVQGSSGIRTADHVSWNQNLGEHYVWSKSGLQKTNKTTAVPVYPEVTDFLVSKIFENYDPAIDEFVVTKLTAQVNVMVQVIGERFLTISYGITPPVFTHVIVFDIAFKRFGKIRIDHVHCFKYVIPNLSGDITWEMLGDLTWVDLGDTTWADFATQIRTEETPKEIIGFLGRDGLVNVVQFDLVHTNDSGILVLGKYQYIRENLLTLDSVQVENMEQGYNFLLKHLVSLNGKTVAYKNDPFLYRSEDLYREFLCTPPQTTGINHTLVAKGTFHISSMTMNFHLAGRK